MAASSTPKDFKALLGQLKSKKRQVVLPSLGVVSVKIKRIHADFVELEGDVGGQSHSFWMHYTAVVVVS